VAKSAVIDVNNSTATLLAAGGAAAIVNVMVCTCGQPGQLLIGGSGLSAANGYPLFPGSQAQYTLIATESLYGMSADVAKISVHVLTWGLL
jgi:hypothetical protein